MALYIGTGVLDKFMGRENKFKEGLTSDVESLLSLYEAAHVGTHGEGILEEAVAFTKHYLTLVLPQLESSHLKRQGEACSGAPDS